MIEQAKARIRELEALLPISANPNFRERLVAHMEHLEESEKDGRPESEFLSRARELLAVYEKQFGVKDVVDYLEEG